MEHHTQALHALIRLHAEIGGKIKDNQRQADRLAGDMLHGEAVIHMLDPSFSLRHIAARRRNKGNPYCKRGEMIRAVMEVLRKATAPLTSPEIAALVLQSFGVQEPTSKDVAKLYSAIHCSLRNHRGKTVEVVNEGRPARWQILGSVVALPVTAEVD